MIASGRFKGRDLANVYLWRGSAYHDKADHDRAIADYSESIRLNQQNSVAYRMRGNSYNFRREYDRALTDLNEAIRLDPKNSGAYNHRGYAYHSKGEYNRAIAAYDEAIRIDPKYADAYRSRGFTFEQMGELEKALVDYRVALSLDQRQDAAGAGAGVSRVEQKLAERSRAKVVTAPPAPPLAPTISPPVVTPPAAETGRRVALVIGNGSYRHSTPLPNPGNDAADMAQALRELGFEVIEGRDLDWAGIHGKVREFARKLDDASMALFFYAGHGVQVDGRNYLVPVDAKLDRAGTLEQDAVDVLSILRPMEAEKRINLVFLDACRDNPLHPQPGALARGEPLLRGRAGSRGDPEGERHAHHLRDRAGQRGGRRRRRATARSPRRCSSTSASRGSRSSR